MSETKFSNNYRDLSQQSGVDAGFQFEFYCSRCSDTWRTHYKPYRSGQASGWLSKAAGFFGGVVGGASSAIEGLANAGWNSARDGAFADAVTQAKTHFHRCAKCFQYVCRSCTDSASGLCFSCAPNVNVEIAAARAQGEIAGATEMALEEGVLRGKRRDVKRELQLTCPSCKAETHGAKFCPECGTKTTTSASCKACSSDIPLDVRFCPACGKSQE